MAEPGLEEGVVSDAIRIQFTHVEITRYEDVVAPPPDTG